MKTLFFLSLFVFGCARNEPSVPAKIPIKVTALPAGVIERIAIAPEDKGCVKDSDCASVRIACSCACPDGVNVAHIQRYSEQVNKMCASYQGKECKMKCDDKIKCIDKRCRSTEKKT